MIEVRFHGRGGQGVVVASELLAQAAFLEGKYPQSFPFFGVERRGAPVTAYTRIGDGPIGVRTGITSPDIVVVLEASLLRAVNVTAGLKGGGLLLANTRAPAEANSLDTNVRVATVDATGIALAHGLGSRSLPIVNTAILGALAGASSIVSLESVLVAIERFVPARREANLEAARDAYRTVSVLKEVLA